MFVYGFYLIGLISLYFLICMDCHTIIWTQLSYRYRRWRRLNNLVSTRHQTAWAVFYHSLCLLCNLFYLSFLQYMNSAIISLDRNRFLVSYVVRGKVYRMIVRPMRGPSPVIQVISDDQQDVTSEVLPYLGPQYDWHGTAVNFESTFKSKRLTFNLSTGEPVTCEDSVGLNLREKGN
jgi:hypothetical protein